MCSKGKVLWQMLLLMALFAGSVIFALGSRTAAQTINLPENVVVGAAEEDEPDVTARVARISFIRGDAQVKRHDSDDWETATLNLPLVEGDEIATGADSRVEIQFDNYQHVRLAANSQLKIPVLKDQGIALSISTGTVSVRVTRFDKDGAYFEIDAPKTTVAIQKAGQYRIDAGQAGENSIRVSVTEKGEARVYSEDAGFTLKSGRTARVFITGDSADDWESDDYATFADEFDSWGHDRDSQIAQRLNSAYYGKYYDQDIYAADDLNAFGDWIYTSQYGYIWRPYSTAVASYVDWTPYRYGAWRWVPPFGWTWVNDEPWGWATYHYGRWVYYGGSWGWSPYGYYRYARSWWFPALVSINIVNNNYCWYPLGYHHHYHNYNAWYNHQGGNHGNPPPIRQTGGIKPIPPSQDPPILGGVKPIPPSQNPPVSGTTKNLNVLAAADEIPPKGVVTVTAEDFGTRIKGGVRTAPPNIAKAVLVKQPDYTAASILPDYSAVRPKISRDLIVTKPSSDLVAASTTVGAAPRKDDAPLDDDLRSKRIRGGRPPGPHPARPGAVERPPVKVLQQPDGPPVRQPQADPPLKPDPPQMPPVKASPRTDPPVRQMPPSYSPPVKQPPRVDTTPTRQPPRQEPPTKAPPVKSEPPPSKAQPSSKPKDAS
jgi:hypothetical protein